MMPHVGFSNQQLALMMAPWTYPYYCWATACGLWWLNYHIMAALLVPPPGTRPS
jgi:hypothetical protein